MNNEGPFKSHTIKPDWYDASNWSEKPLEERVRILTNQRKGQSMMGQFRPAPKVNYPTAENDSERRFKIKSDAIYNAGQTLDIPWCDYLGVTRTMKKGDK
tara:strand:- start:30 stop:329 length:300 start_codon:yes stop_codon:yes gene_type:complete